MRICKILIVEDDDAVRDLLGELFEDEGYDFTLVEDGEGMRNALAEDDYEVALIDVSLKGGEDGVGLADVAYARGCSVILTTGDPAKLERAQSTSYSIPKPFRMRELMGLVARVLQETKKQCQTRHGGTQPGAAPPS